MQPFSALALFLIIGLCTGLPQFDFSQQQPQFNSNQPQQQQQQQQQQPPTVAPVLDRAFYNCFNNCPTLSQYNPVCGSDGQNYHNDQKLQCHNVCGQRSNANWTPIALVRMGTCAPLG